jgi:hydroxymethylglutaryl-CoA reductase
MISLKTMSDIPFSNFHKLDPQKRLDLLAGFCKLDKGESALLSNMMKTAEESGVDYLENQVGAYILPLAFATGFVVNDVQRLVPMVTEEPGIVAGSSLAAKAVAKQGGFVSRLLDDRVLGHIICLFSGDPQTAADIIENTEETLIEQVNANHPSLKKAGGGLKDIHLYAVRTPENDNYLKIDLIADTCDLMGAGIITTMAEELAKLIEEMIECKTILRVISNDAGGRMCECTATVDPKDIGGYEVAKNIVYSTQYAYIDPQRAITHNKGILNGMIAFAMATGNDTRALEAGAHFYASNSGTYLPLTEWKIEDGKLKGIIRAPVPVGSIGGTIGNSKITRLCYKILGTESGKDIREICAAVGLAANLGVLRALVTKGIGSAHRRKTD